MREHDLQPKRRRRYIVTTDSDHAGPIFPDLAKLNQELAVAPASQQAAVIRKINTAFAKDMPWVPLTTLTFLDVSRQPTSVIQSPIGWVMNIG